MTLLWTDGMDRYGAAADVSSLYTGAPTSYQAAAGVGGVGAFRYSGTTGSVRTFVTAGVLTAGNGVHACVWMKPGGFSQQQSFLRISDGTNFADLISNSDGSFSALRFGDFAVLATSGAGALTVGNYVHVEYAAKFNTGVNGGYIKVWIGGNLVINFAGTTTSVAAPTAYGSCRIGKTLSGLSSVWDFDDLICWDEQGTDFALTQLTTAYLPIIETLSIDGNDAVQFTPLTSTNASQVDDPAFEDGDTTYNSSSVTSDQDTFTVANQGSTPAYTFAVIVRTWVKIQTAGTTQFRTLLDSGGTVVQSADRLLPTSYSHYADFFGKDPNTSAVWGTTAVNSVKTGYKNQSVT